MRKLLALVGVVVLATTLTGCMDRETQLHRDSEFRDLCIEHRGTLERNYNTGHLWCDLVTEE